MNSNAEKSNKKILRNLKRFFIWAHNRNLCYETPKVYSFFHEIFLGFARNLKGFRSKGFDCVAGRRTFLSSVEFFYCFFRHLNDIYGGTLWDTNCTHRNLKSRARSDIFRWVEGSAMGTFEDIASAKSRR